MVPKGIKQVSCDEILFDEANSDEVIERFVAKELLSLVPAGARIITFDGFDGVGKSTLARQLAKKLDVPVVELDNFLNKQQGRFLEALDLPRLSAATSNALGDSNRVIVEGCQVEAALDRLNLQSGFRFYVMRTTRMRSNPTDEWVREYDTLYGEDSTEDLLEERKGIARRAAKMPEEFGGGGNGDPSSLDQELILYHRTRHPHDHADVIVKIVHWS